MKQFVFITYLLTLSFGAAAQREDLKKLSADYERLIVSDKTFHLAYDLTVSSKLDSSAERMHVDLYKSGMKDCIRMGESQVVIHDGTFLLVVNDQVRTLRFSDDSANLSSRNILISDFISVIDSSASVTLHTKDNTLRYVLTFSETYGYRSVELVFSKKTKHLLKIHAVFEDDYPSEIKSIEVTYSEPDLKWVPAADFPGTATYITRLNGRYVIQEAYDSYKVY